MSSKILYQRGFNDLFFKFMEDIIRMFSHDQDFIVAKTTFETLKKANPSSLIKAWYKFITIPFIEYSSSIHQKSTENVLSPSPEKGIDNEGFRRSEAKVNPHLPECNEGEPMDLPERSVGKDQLSAAGGGNLNIILFLENFDVIFQNNRISELNNFFVKLNRELRTVIENNDHLEINKILVVEKYFNQLNTLAVSFSNIL
jgi:hypothetical protein